MDVICRATLFCVLTVEADVRAILQIIESAVAQNLRDYVDAVQLVAPDLRAAAAACAGGTAAFIGVGSPLTTVKGAGPEITNHELDAAEAFFEDVMWTAPSSSSLPGPPGRRQSGSAARLRDSGLGRRHRSSAPV